MGMAWLVGLSNQWISNQACAGCVDVFEFFYTIRSICTNRWITHTPSGVQGFSFLLLRGGGAAAWRTEQCLVVVGGKLEISNQTRCSFILFDLWPAETSHRWLWHRDPVTHLCSPGTPRLPFQELKGASHGAVFGCWGGCIYDWDCVPVCVIFWGRYRVQHVLHLVSAVASTWNVKQNLQAPHSHNSNLW